MDIVYNKFVSAGYTRTNNPISDKIVVHAIAGSGKSSLIRELLCDFNCFEAFTFGVADPVNLSGNRIRGFEDFGNREGKHLIIDEYLGGEVPQGALLILADPNQYRSDTTLAHFVSYRTHRYGFNTCSLLRELGFIAQSDKPDLYTIEHIFRGEVEGQILCYEEEIFKILDRHRIDYLKHCQVRGATFDVVTFVCTEGSFKEEDRYKAYICLTRHKKVLHILNPDASYTAPRLQ